MEEVSFKIVKVIKPAEYNIIIGQAHFIKTIEDIYEVLVGSMPNIKFGIAFCESSGQRLVRVEGNDPELREIASNNAYQIGCGHIFFIVLKEAYPINVLNQLKLVPEVCTIFCATANPVEVIVAQTSQGRSLIGVVDGAIPQGVEKEEGVRWRREFLRKIGYKK